MLNFFKKRKRAPKIWIITTFMVILLAALVLFLVKLFSHSPTAPEGGSIASVSLSKKDGGKKANPEYAKKVEQLNEKEKNIAEKTGQSYIATLVKSENDIISEKINAEIDSVINETRNTERTKIKPKKDSGEEWLANIHKKQKIDLSDSKVVAPKSKSGELINPRRRTANQQEQITAMQQRMQASILQELENINKSSKLNDIKTVTVAELEPPVTKDYAKNSFTEPEIEEVQNIKLNEEKKDRDSFSELDIKVGDILYALNELKVSSKNPGITMARVISGKLKGARLIGEITVNDETMAVRYNSLLYEGERYPVLGYAVNPQTSSTEVQTAVDHHYFERWVPFIAASFLSGFGKAVENSDMNSAENLDPSGMSTVKSYPHYNLSDQAWIAAGETGSRMSDILAQKINKPATVTLDANVPLGIIIIEKD